MKRFICFFLLFAVLLCPAASALMQQDCAVHSCGVHRLALHRPYRSHKG